MYEQLNSISYTYIHTHNIVLWVFIYLLFFKQ